MPRQWSPWFLVLPILLVWHHITQWSSGIAPVLLTGHYPMPVVTWWSTTSTTDLREHFLLSGIFYLAILPAFSRPPWVISWTSKLVGLHGDLWNIASAQLLVRITTIHKRFICGRFYLRAKAGWSQNINLHGEFTETLFLKHLLLTGFELSSQ